MINNTETTIKDGGGGGTTTTPTGNNGNGGTSNTVTESYGDGGVCDCNNSDGYNKDDTGNSYGDGGVSDCENCNNSGTTGNESYGDGGVSDCNDCNNSGTTGNESYGDGGVSDCENCDGCNTGGGNTTGGSTPGESGDPSTVLPGPENTQPESITVDVGEKLFVGKFFSPEFGCGYDIIEIEGDSIERFGSGNNLLMPVKPGVSVATIEAMTENNVVARKKLTVTVRGMKLANSAETYTITDGSSINVGFEVYGYDAADVVCRYDEDMFEVYKDESNNSFTISPKSNIISVMNSEITFGIADETDPNGLKYSNSIYVSVEADVYIICNSGNGLFLSYPYDESRSGGGVNAYKPTLYVDYPVFEKEIRIWNIVKENGVYYLKLGGNYATISGNGYELSLCDNISAACSVMLESVNTEESGIYKIKFESKYATLTPSTTNTNSTYSYPDPVMLIEYYDGTKVYSKASHNARQDLDDTPFAFGDLYPCWKIVSVASNEIQLGFDRFGKYEEEIGNLALSAGYSFYGRYINDAEFDNEWKDSDIESTIFSDNMDYDLSPSEVEDIHTKGFSIYSIYERVPHEEFPTIEEETSKADFIYEKEIVINKETGEKAYRKLMFFAVNGAFAKGYKDAKRAVFRARYRYSQPEGTAIYFALEPETLVETKESITARKAARDEGKTEPREEYYDLNIEGIKECVYQYIKGASTYFKEQSEDKKYHLGFYGISDYYHYIENKAIEENIDLNIEHYMHPGSVGALYYGYYNNNRLFDIKQMNQVTKAGRYESFFTVDPNITYSKSIGDWAFTTNAAKNE